MGRRPPNIFKFARTLPYRKGVGHSRFCGFFFLVTLVGQLVKTPPPNKRVLGTSLVIITIALIVNLPISRELKAFIWDSPVLLYETSSNCDLTTAGEIFGRSGYAIGMPKGSPWSDSISVAILHFHESGIIERLESAWIEFGNCPQQSSSPTTLGLSHMLGKLGFYSHFCIYSLINPSSLLHVFL